MDCRAPNAFASSAAEPAFAASNGIAKATHIAVPESTIFFII
jgi:hypothetical protein